MQQAYTLFIFSERERDRQTETARQEERERVKQWNVFVENLIQ